MENAVNVLLGPAKIYLDSANMGWTKGGVSIAHSATFYFVNVDQETSPVKTRKTDETFKVSTVLVELTLANIKKAWGIDSSIDFSTHPGYGFLPFGGLSQDAPEHALEIVGTAPGLNNRERTIGFYKVVAIEFGDMTINKDKEAEMPVTFECLIDTTKANGKQVGYFKDELPEGESNVLCKVTVTS